MKRLISAVTVNEARKAGKNEIVTGGKSTIITAEAKDLAKKYGIRFVDSPAVGRDISLVFDKDTIRLIVEKAIEQLPPEKRDMSAVSEAVLKVLKQYKK